MEYRNAVQFILVNENDEFLIVHPQGWKEGYYKFPSGGIEEGESPEAAMARELYEELCVKDFKQILSLPKSGRYEWDKKTIEQYNHKYKGQQLHTFILKVNEGINIKPCEKEINHVRWVSKDEFEKYFLWPGQLDHARRIIEIYEL